MYGIVTIQRAKAKTTGGFEILPFETSLKLINGKATIEYAETDGTGPLYDSAYLFRVQNGYCGHRYGFMAALPDGTTPITTGELPMVDPITGEGIYMDAQEWNALYGDLPNRVESLEGRVEGLEALGGLSPESPIDGQTANLIEQDGTLTSAAVDARIITKGVSTDYIAANYVPKNHLTLNVKDFGAKGDNSTDDLPAFNDAFAELVARGGGELYIPAGKYRLSDEWNIYRTNSPRRDVVIRGESQWTTFIYSNFYGADKALIKSRDPLGATRCSPTSLMNLQLGTVSRNGPNPVLLDIYGHGESRLESIRFGSCNNSHMSLSSLQNVRMRDIVSFYGGKHFNYKNTAGITFTSTSGSSTLTASAPVFSGTDPGRQIMLMRADGTRAKYRITNYTDPQTVSISSDTPAVNISNAPAVFEPARITTTAGSNQVSANSQCFTADDIGRVIYIWGAAQGAWGAGVLRGRITELVSGATVRLDVNADISLTRTEFAAPVVDIYTPSGLGTINADSNDVKIDLLHIENYAGVGLVVESSVFMHIDKMKIHGEHAPTDTFASLSHMWLDDYSGTISGELDGAATGDHRVGLCNMNDMLTFTHLSTRQIYNEKTFQVGTMTNAGGIAEVQSFNAYAATAGADPYLLVDDPNADPRLLFTGLVNMLGDALPPRIYAGKNTYFTKTGEMVTKTPNGTSRKILVADDGTISSVAV